jgi:hypothetical protein
MSDMKYVRLFAGPDGETHFEDVAFELHSSPSSLPMPPFELSEPLPAERFSILSFPPGWRSEHHAPRRQLLILQTGSAGFRTSDGETRYFHAGDVFLAEDTTGKGHTSWNDSDDTLLAVVIHLPK